MEQEIKLLKKYNIALKNAYTMEREEKKKLKIEALKWKAKYESLLGDLKKNKESVQREKENSSNEEEDKKEDENEKVKTDDKEEDEKEDVQESEEGEEGKIKKKKGKEKKEDGKD